MEPKNAVELRSIDPVDEAASGNDIKNNENSATGNDLGLDAVQNNAIPSTVDQHMASGSDFSIVDLESNSEPAVEANAKDDLNVDAVQNYAISTTAEQNMASGSDFSIMDVKSNGEPVTENVTKDGQSLKMEPTKAVESLPIDPVDEAAPGNDVKNIEHSAIENDFNAPPIQEDIVQTFPSQELCTSVAGLKLENRDNHPRNPTTDIDKQEKDQGFSVIEESFEQFLNREDKLLQDVSTITKARLQGSFEEKLRDVCPPETAREIAEDFLEVPGVQIKQDAVGKKSLFDEIKGEVKEFLGIVDRKFVFFYAPKEETVDGAIEPYEKSVEERKEHIKQFIDTFKLTKEGAPTRSVEVASYRALKEELVKILQEETDRCYILWLFFSGHGSDDGHLIFEKGPTILIDDYIEQIKLCVEQNRVTQGRYRLPDTLQIVFTQCFGHVFNHPVASPGIFIHSLTNDSYVKTHRRLKGSHTNYSKKNIITKITHAKHYDLNKFALECNKCFTGISSSLPLTE